MAAMYVERTSRKQRSCARGCGDPIRPGDRYVIATIPPHTEPAYSSEEWVKVAMHGRHWENCPAHAATLTHIAAETALAGADTPNTSITHPEQPERDHQGPHTDPTPAGR